MDDLERRRMKFGAFFLESPACCRSILGTGIGYIQFVADGVVVRMLSLKTVSSVLICQGFDTGRPIELLGDQIIHLILQLIESAFAVSSGPASSTVLSEYGRP
jgi:hypothetical protein